MKEPAQAEYEAVEGVRAWLHEERVNSSTGSNAILDDLEWGRQALINHHDHKFESHVGRHNLFADQYSALGYSRDQDGVQSIANFTFGALMFLSGADRRQRYLLSSNQADYDRRKKEDDHPSALDIYERLAIDLEGSRDVEYINPAFVRKLGAEAIRSSVISLEVSYKNAPQDFYKEMSPSIEAIKFEQHSWAVFLAAAIREANNRLDLNDVSQTPTREPKTITEAQLTTLYDVYAAYSLVR